MSANISCEFSEPYKIDPLDEFWQFQKSNCTSTDQYSLLVKPEGQDNEFVLDKTLTYGDILFFSIFFILFLFLIFKFVWDFIFPRSVKHLTEKDL